jgi:hypothetical protein
VLAIALRAIDPNDSAEAIPLGEIALDVGASLKVAAATTTPVMLVVTDRVTVLVPPPALLDVTIDAKL